LADALALSRAFVGRPELAIVGAGLIGMEVASSAVSRGIAVTVVDAASGPLMRVLSADVSTRLSQWYEGKGVRVAFGRAIESIAPKDDGQAIQLDDGSVITADCVVVAIGSQPNLAWLAGSDLPLDNGVLADATGLVCGTLDVYVVGDVASWWDPDTGRHTRHEHWTRAIEQAACLAHNICHPEDRTSVTTPAYAWSDQFGCKLQMLGHVGSDESKFVAGGGPDQWAALSGSAGELVGATFMNWPRGVARARRALLDRSSVDEMYGQLA
jgi:NADPH-dependent 2,4-dienoyl-CoA reductase/sulfur reductase-like enzyme